MKINDTIRLLRLHKGYSQEYIAEQIGIDAVTYGRIERGITKLTIERLDEISKILEYSIIKIFELSGNIPDRNNENSEYLSKMLKYNIQLSEQILNELRK